METMQLVFWNLALSFVVNKEKRETPLIAVLQFKSVVVGGWNIIAQGKEFNALHFKTKELWSGWGRYRDSYP